MQTFEQIERVNNVFEQPIRIIGRVAAPVERSRHVRVFSLHSGSTLEPKGARHLPVATWKGGRSEQCIICITDFSAGEEVRTLPCLHRFHRTCVDQWLSARSVCPLCKSRVTDRLC